MDYITTIEMSKIWGISSRRISLLCSQEECLEQRKRGKTWLHQKRCGKANRSSKEKQMTYWRL